MRSLSHAVVGSVSTVPASTRSLGSSRAAAIMITHFSVSMLYAR
nr:MAG TPA: hypothetical protein [Caudoviricetes sp.]